MGGGHSRTRDAGSPGVGAATSDPGCADSRFDSARATRRSDYVFLRNTRQGDGGERGRRWTSPLQKMLVPHLPSKRPEHHEAVITSVISLQRGSTRTAVPSLTTLVASETPVICPPTPKRPNYRPFADAWRARESHSAC